MNNQQFFWDNQNYLYDSDEDLNLNLKPQKNSDKPLSNNYNNNSPIEFKKEIDNKISSPFSTDSISTTHNFDEEKIREKLQEILPTKNQHLLDKIIKDKKYYFPNDLKVEKGVFRDNEGNLIQVVYGNEKGFISPQIY